MSVKENNYDKPVKEERRKMKNKSFTLIELLVITAQHCRDFFRGFICTDQYGCVRKHTENTALKNKKIKCLKFH